jgi:hypothetical protein
MKVCCLISFCICLSVLSRAQSTVLIKGQVSNMETGKGIDGVVIHTKEGNQTVQSGKNGSYQLRVSSGEKIKFEFLLLGYETAEKEIMPSGQGGASADTIYLNISLKPKPIPLHTVDVFSRKMDTVFGNMHFFVEDFEFYGDRFILLTYENNLKKARVRLVDENQKTLMISDYIPDEAVEFYKDFQGYVNVVCKEQIYRLLFEDNRIVLGQLPVEQFRKEIMPCTDTLKGRILFSNYYRDYPAFSWFTYNRRDTTVKKLKYIKDKELLESYEEAFDFLKPRDRLNARKLEISTGIDKRVIAAEMTGFPQSLFYTPVYAPLFVVRVTVCIFDHYTDWMFCFSTEGKEIDSFRISYHHPKDWKEWKHKLIQDRATRTLYALFLKDGRYILRRVDPRSGQITLSYTVSNKYANHLKVKNDQVYYVYRPFDSGQTKFLYKEKLPE